MTLPFYKDYPTILLLLCSANIIHFKAVQNLLYIEKQSFLIGIRYVEICC